VIRTLLLAWIGLLGLAGVTRQVDWPGLEALRTLQGWWLARQFDASALHDDDTTLRRVGERIFLLTGDSKALLFAADRVGFQATAPRPGLHGAEAREASRWAVEVLEGHLEHLEDPWEARRIQAFIIVNRQTAPSLEHLGLTAASAWFAAGGGPSWPMTIGEVYRLGLTLTPAERAALLRGSLRILVPEGD